MDQQKLNELIGNIKDKVGEEMSSVIADDLGALITENENTNNTLAQKDKEISELNSTKESLIMSNGNLLKQISMDATKNPFEERIEKEEVEFNIYDAFDKNGNFI